MENLLNPAAPTGYEVRARRAKPEQHVDLPLTVIERQPGWHLVNLGELWRHRELLYFLVWRDVKVRYKQTVLGVGWSVFKPFITVVVFSFFIGRRLAGHSGDLSNFGIVVFAGVLPWMFFATSFPSAAHSVAHANELVTKVNFPRLLLPLSCILANMVDFAVGLVMLVAVAFFFHATPGPNVAMIPVIILLLLAAATGVGTLLAALMVKYRDFSHLVQFMTQMWFFATPTIFMEIGAETSAREKLFSALNPLYGLIANFRTAILGGSFNLDVLFVSGAVSLILLFFGCLYFRRVERGFADVI
jgi:lipopolysaccharide transport system permease protein